MVRVGWVVLALVDRVRVVLVLVLVAWVLRVGAPVVGD